MFVKTEIEVVNFNSIQDISASGGGGGGVPDIPEES